MRKNLMDDSSDDDAGPDDLGMGRRPVSPQRRAPPSPGIARRMSSFEPGMPARHDSASPASSGGSRPQSMFIPNSHSPSPSHSQAISGLPSEGHQRRASINNIVSRYEAMSHYRPAVAAKPANLAGAHTGGAGGIKSPPIPPSIPTKPQLLRKPSGGRPMPGSGGAGAGLKRASTVNVRSRPATAAKPMGLQAGQAVMHAEPASVQVPAETMAAPATTTTTTNATTPSPRPPSAGSGSGSRASSPEKQQSVNLLIARWNKGQV
jgi:AP2-associated kinase